MKTLFYRNFRLLILTICLIVFWGISSYQLLPRMEDPPISDRWAVITTSFPGANAYRVESLVTDKIEAELSEIAEIEDISSTSRLGVSTVQIKLYDRVVEIEKIKSLIRDRLDDTTSQLPTEASKPKYEDTITRARTLIVGLAWDFESAPNYFILRRLAQQLKQDLSAISGTEQVELFGSVESEIVVEIEPSTLASIGLTPQDLSQQIRSSDAKVSAGQVYGSTSDILMEVNGELDDLERIKKIPIRFGDLGQSMRLEDIAEVKKGVVEPMTETALINGKPGIILGVLMNRDRRIDRWTNNARKEIKKFQQQLTEGVNLQIIFDQSIYVNKRLNDLFINLLLGTLLIMGSSLVMMGWKSAIAIASILPLSILMVLGGMNLFHIPMHQMSVTGLVIALGLLVDNAIVVVDEVNKELNRGFKPHQAISKAIGYLTVPLLASTFTSVLTFLPIAFVPGATGDFVRSLAVSVILALVCSLFLTLTIIPALTGRLNNLVANGKVNQNYSWWNNGISNYKITQVYTRVLKYVFQKPVLGIILALILPVTGFVMATSLEKQFFPPAQRDRFQIELELSSAASVEETKANVLRVNSLLQNHSEIVNLHWSIGRNAPKFYYNLNEIIEGRSNYAQALVQTKSSKGITQLIRTLQQELDSALPKPQILVRQLEQGPYVDAPIELRLYGSDLELLRELGDRLRLSISKIDDVINTEADLSNTSPKFKLDLDETEAKLAGLDNTAIARSLDANLEGAVGGSMLEATEEFPVRVRLSNSDRSDRDRIASLPLLREGVSSEDGLSIPLDAVGEIKLTSELTSISRRNGERINNIQVFVRAGVLPSKVLEEIKGRIATNIELPADYLLEFGGEQAEREGAVDSLLSIVGIVLILMISALVLSFSSFALAAIIVMVAICSIGLGLFSLWLFSYPFGFMAILGTVGLVGIAINDSIMILTAIHSHVAARQGDKPGGIAVQRRVITQVVIDSTRHVLTTTITTIIGFSPLIVAGAEFWHPLAICIVGGVGGATFLAIFLVPCIYLLMINRRSRIKSQRSARTSKELELAFPRSSTNKTESNF